MECDYYFKYETGTIPDNEFIEHLRGCETCRSRYMQDKKLLTLASSLKQPVAEGGLWTKIENELIFEKHQSNKGKSKSAGYRGLLIRVAAVLILGLSTGLYFMMNREIPDKGILETHALENVDKTEQEYEKAIENLEQLASTEMSKFDLNLQLLYRDKLETIDSQIIACREALESNPANAHIRHYLFMALQDKKDTLKEIISIPADTDKKDS